MESSKALLVESHVAHTTEQSAALGLDPGRAKCTTTVSAHLRHMELGRGQSYSVRHEVPVLSLLIRCVTVVIYKTSTHIKQVIDSNNYSSFKMYVARCIS